MCNVVVDLVEPAATETLNRHALYTVRSNDYRLNRTRWPAFGGSALICHHGDRWELTPELKPGEWIHIPEGARFQIVSMSDWERGLYK